MSKETDDAVDAFLTSIFVEYHVTHMGEGKLDEWEHDRWSVTFKGPNKTRCETEFRTGLGLRKKAKRPVWEAKIEGPRGAARFHRLNDKPQAPRAASVLYSLLMDGQALDISFNNWCDECGYDPDSMKAFSIYQACCEIGKKMHTMFNRENRETLAKLLEDY